MNLTIDQAKDKVRKLLAMVSPESGASQQEMETALKKARKIMADMKISEKDVQVKKEEKIITIYMNEVYFTTLTNPWINTLNKTIAENYCCRNVVRKTGKTMIPGFIGFESDVEIATSVFRAAMALSEMEIKILVRNQRRWKKTAAEITAMKNAYGNGYVRGLADALKEQTKTEDESFALALSVPAPVTEKVTKTCQTIKFDLSKATRKAREYDGVAAKGYLDGKEFTARPVIA